MCGIAGIYGPEGKMTAEERRQMIGRMCDVIRHRGPDDVGHYIDGGLALGMRRLSIIDLSTGHQPLSNEDGTIWIVFNGEIYNFAELRSDLESRGHFFRTRTDTETIIHLYEEEGEDCVKKLRGMFAFAIWDQRERKIVLARDRVGKKPLHFTLVGETFLFGSEIKSLLQHPEVKREVDLESISDYLSFGYVPDPATAFRGISKLPPGHTLVYQNGLIRTNCYWDFVYDDAAREPHSSEQDYVVRLRELIEEAVRLRLVSDVPLGAFLSGGIDSSTVVGMMSRIMDRPVKTFSIGFTEGEFDELKYARMTARHFGTEHHEFVVTPDVCQLVEEIVWHHDEPFADASSIPSYVVSMMAREHVTVALSGDGGDELFAGYERYLVHREREVFERTPAWLRQNLFLRASHLLPRAAYGKNYLRNISLEAGARYVDSLSYFNPQAKESLLAKATRSALANHDGAAWFRQLFDLPTSSESLDHLLYLDSKTYLPGDILTKVDRMSMAHSLEARVPLLDHKLIEFVQAIPAHLKLHGRETKYILKKAVQGLIPDEVINRSKHGFGVPLRKWFNRELRELLHDTLTDKRARERGLLNQRAVRALIGEHQRGRRDNSIHLWGLLTLELWHRAFIDRQPEPSFIGAKGLGIRQLAAKAGGAEGHRGHGE